MHPRTQRKFWLFTLLLSGVLVWMICIVLLMLVTTTLLDTLEMIINLAQMG
jgi:hypothetical protein